MTAQIQKVPIGLIKILLSSAIAAVFASFFVLSLYSDYKRFNDGKNPFITLENDSCLDQKEKEVSMTTIEGDLFFASADADFCLRDGKKNLKKGALYWSREMAGDSIVMPNKEIAGKRALSVEKILVFSPLGDSIIIHDPGRSITQIFATNQPTYFWFPGAEHPFQINPGMMVTVLQKQINEKTKDIFFTKKRKGLQYKPYYANDWEEKIVLLETEKTVKHTGLKTFLKNHFTNENVLEKISGEKSRIFYGYQKFFWNGLDKYFEENAWIKFLKEVRFSLKIDKKHDYDVKEFQKEIADFYEALKMIADGNTVEAEGKLTNFKKQKNNSNFLRNIPPKSAPIKDWEAIAKIQKGWLLWGRSLDSNTQVLIKFWFDNPTEGLDELHRLLFLTQNAINKNNIAEAKSLMEMFEKAFSSQEKTFGDMKIPAEKFSNIRRQFFLITTESKLNTLGEKNTEYLDLYRRMALTESNFYETKAEKEEIRLEVAQDILSYIQKLLGERNSTNNKRIDALVEIYQELEIDNLEEILGRKVFSADEKIIIQVVQISGAKGLRLEEIDNVKVFLENNSDLENKDPKETEKNEIDLSDIFGDSNEDEYRETMEFFIFRNFDSEEFITRSAKYESRKNGEILAKGILYKDYETTIIYDPKIHTINATTLQKNDEKIRLISEKTALTTAIKEIQNWNPKQPEKEEGVFDFQNVWNIQSERKKILRKIEAETGIVIGFEKFLARTQELKWFDFLEAKYGNGKIIFDGSYNAPENVFSDIVVHTENQKISMEIKNVPAKDLLREMAPQLKEILEKQKK